MHTTEAHGTAAPTWSPQTITETPAPSQRNVNHTTNTIAAQAAIRDPHNTNPRDTRITAHA